MVSNTDPICLHSVSSSLSNSLYELFLVCFILWGGWCPVPLSGAKVYLNACVRCTRNLSGCQQAFSHPTSAIFVTSHRYKWAAEDGQVKHCPLYTRLWKLVGVGRIFLRVLLPRLVLVVEGWFQPMRETTNFWSLCRRVNAAWKMMGKILA